MTSRHTSSRQLIGSGLFDNLTAFSEIEARISALPSNKDRGDAFEIFAEAYFATQKIAQAQEVWPFEAVPLAQRQALALDTGRDMGVDGTYLTVDGELRAYQVKFRSRRTALTWEDLSTFMGLTDQVSQRVLFTNSESLPALMQDRSGFVPIRGSDLDRLTAEDFEAMRQWLQTGQVKLPRKTPLPHQAEALAAIAHGLQSNDRATVVMACGTGKSLVALWAAERHDCKTMLVLVPSLALVRQLLHEWLRETAWDRLTFMCVCSDPTVAKGADDLIVHQADLDFPVTTDSAVVTRFITKAFDGIKIIFSTYQSAQVVAAGMPVGADGMVQPFDLAVFDEAHKTASRDGTRFSFALEDVNLRIRKRLFFTATPRHYDVRKKDSGGDSTLVYSMDRPEVYGPVIHTLSFAEAARRGIICDYKVVISVVTSDMVNDDLLKHGEVLVDGDLVKARQVALQIALQKAVEKYGVCRIFTFHGSVAAARSFTSSDSEGIQQHLPDFTTLHVSGEMPTSRREDQMKAFRQADKAVISNARCLTEGVDVPAVDMVAFISPRKSKVDIVQATGRAMRKSPGKEFGYVMVPLFVEQSSNESIEEALQRTGFDDVWDLLGAMREQDDVLVDIIRQMQEDKGRTGGYNDSRFSERVEVLGPSVSLETIRASITAECLESIGTSWDERFGELLAYKEEKGDANVQQHWPTGLGRWVSAQRVCRDTMSAARRAQLEALPGWTWNARESAWEEGFHSLQAFVDEKRHSRVPGIHKSPNGYRLGQWVLVQRTTRSSLSSERTARLEALPGWSWDALSDQWDEASGYLKIFTQTEGHAKPSARYRASDGYRLGQWVAVQRLKKDAMSLERRFFLEALPGWIWDVVAENWDAGYRCLKEYTDKVGHAKVPKDFKTEAGYQLGQWVGSQRRLKDTMPMERKNRLESLFGWVWDSKEDAWEIGFRYLQEFSGRNGHVNVPRNYKAEDGYLLGSWLGNQKIRQQNLETNRREKLEALPGWAWNTKDAAWDSWYECLVNFVQRDGHCNPPAKYVTDEGLRLGSWVSNQRKLKDEMPQDRRDQLEALSGWIWDAIAEQWETGFLHLQSFALREGHCKVPTKFLTPDDYKLGTWLSGQRYKRESMSIGQRERLEGLPGWVWDAIAEQWEIGYRHLQDFASRQGNCKVSKQELALDGYRLGQWVQIQKSSWGTMPIERKERLEKLPDWQSQVPQSTIIHAS